MPSERSNVVPLLAKRRKSAPIGCLVEYYLCMNCAAGGEMADARELLREGDDAGVPYTCYRCDGKLVPRG